MSEYQAIARKYRPKTFTEVLGQEAVVTTLKNAIRNKQTAHAYLFSGPRGTGKTTLARIFAKAVNCKNPINGIEPCNSCTSCQEITSGNSLDVIEIDGASNRGIEDIRQINDTVSYQPNYNYKIYIIDEVHMLTKEAFNALLKTLEEPPEKVKFFFATTELHKVLPTIQSRCQRYSLNRIGHGTIIQKLQKVAADLNVTIEDAALQMVAERAEGGLRDAESLLDQILSFQESPIKKEHVAEALGVVTNDLFFSLDQAGKEGNLKAAFEIAEQVVSQGKSVAYFLEMLSGHIRNLLLTKLGGAAPSPEYQTSAGYYRSDQLADLMEYLLHAQEKIRYTLSGQTYLEAVLLHVIRSHRRIPVDLLVKKLSKLQEAPGQIEPAPPKPPEKLVAHPPTPKPKKTKQPPPPLSETTLDKKNQSRYDTLLQFAAVELEGKLTRS